MDWIALGFRMTFIFLPTAIVVIIVVGLTDERCK